MPPIPSAWAFLVDENTSRTLAEALRSSGYVAEHVVEAGLQGHPDANVFAYAQAHHATLITADLDFAQIPVYPPPHAGILVLRLPDTMPTSELIQEVLRALATLGGQNLADVLFIIEPGRMRRRP